MDDNMRFSPDKLSFKRGDTVRFVVRNQGKLLHELVIGTKKELDEHAAMMLKHPACSMTIRPWFTSLPAKPAASSGPSTAPASLTLPA
jgi:uncharacterized cupredoxin-like copper-binding protein